MLEKTRPRAKTKPFASTLTIPSNATVEELEVILEDVTRSRDALKAENSELKKQIEELERARVESS